MEILINPNERLLRLPDVKSKLGKGRSSIYKEMNEGTFPQSISLGGRSVAWLESEIDAWIAKRIKESRGKTSSTKRGDHESW